MSLTHRASILFSLVTLTLVPALQARDVPAAVSPGATSSVAQVGSACPSFSWSAVADATGYELVVYELLTSGEAAPDPTLSLTLPAGVSSWSPSGVDCLGAGKSYAWLVRVDGETPEPWSEARFFRVPDRPSIDEVQEALDVLRHYFGEDRIAVADAAATGGAIAADRQIAPSTSGPKEAASSSPLSTVSEEALATGASAMRGELPDTTGVTYGVVGISNSGDGSALAGDNTAGGADLLLGGAVPAQVTENLWQLDSGDAQTFSFENPSGEMSVLVDGLEVLAGSITGDEITDGTVVFSDWSQNGCTSGEIPTWDGASWSCGSAGGTATDLDCTDCVDNTEIVDGSGSGVDADLLDGIDSTGFAGTGHDHYGQSWSGTLPSGSGLSISNTSGVGISGTSDESAAYGVFGENNATEGTALGVYGRTASEDGTAILGEVTATTGFGKGVRGSTETPGGSGVVGSALNSSGFTMGVRGSTHSTQGTAGYFTASNGGLLLAATSGGGDFTGLADFMVANDGTVTATGFVGDGSGLTNVSADDADTLDGIDSTGFFVLSDNETVTGIPAFNGGASGVSAPFSVDSNSIVANLNADLLDGNDATAFAPSSHDHFGESWQGTDTSDGLQILNQATSGLATGVEGRTASTQGRGLFGFATSTSGGTQGVWGESSSTMGTGLFGLATATTGITYGVEGSASSTDGTGVMGLANATSGSTRGVGGESASPDGRGVFGTASATTGSAVGVWGESDSINGAGGLFVHTNGGTLLAANDTPGFSDLEFKVDALGNVYADGTYRCGNSIDDGAGTLDESEIAPCLTDDFPADFAEMLPRSGDELEPGDVLAVDAEGRLVATTDRYQATVVGVYSTRPSYVGNSRYIDDEGYAPLALTGLVPVKVTDENGPVRPGTLLTTSSTPGHAMRAGAESPQGTIIGKALEPLDGSRGKVLMMVVLQ